MKAAKINYLAYDYDIVRLLQKYFPKEKPPANTRKTANQEKNEFIYTSYGTSHAFHMISDDFVCFIENYQTNSIKEYSIAPSSSSFVKSLTPPPNFSLFYPHKHDYLELLYLLHGELDFYINKERKRYYAGECCLINQNVQHKLESVSSRCTIIHLAVQPSYIKKHSANGSWDNHSSLFQFLFQNTVYNANINYLDFYPVKHTDDQNNELSLSYIFYVLIKEMLEQHTGYHDILSGYLKRLLYILQQPAQYTCKNICYQQTKHPSLFGQMLAYIQSHRYKINREELAHELHYSGNYLSDIFQQNTGITLSAYIRDICLQEAASLLLNTELNIDDIVHLIHYENKTVFYKHFRNKYGVTPKEYRSSKNILIPKASSQKGAVAQVVNKNK